MVKHKESVVRPKWSLTDARWSFLVSNDRSHSVPRLRWWWRAVAKNGVTWEGDEGFTSLNACQLDAETHGFEPQRAQSV